ncbi:MAG: hypothetical protein AAF928_00315 [Myxococcota bacterium]
MRARAVASAAFALAALMGTAPALASPEASSNAFASGTTALEEGRYQDAIDHFEAYADRMPSHPDASFNRGLAYVMRVERGAGEPGDLGRAAAALEETLDMRADDAEARAALDAVHAEVARRRARAGKDAVLARPSLDRLVTRLFSETTWAALSVLGALVLASGIVMRRLRRQGPLHLAGVLMIPLGLLTVVGCVPLYHAARSLRLDTRPGVIVVREAHLTDERGTTQGAEAIPEAARVEVGARRGRRVPVRYGTSEGWLPASSVRLLRTR